MGFFVQLATLRVAADVQRKRNISCELAALFQHGIDRVRIHVGMGRHGFEVSGDVEQFVHHKLHIAQGGVVNRHANYSLRWEEEDERGAAAAVVGLP